MGQLGEVFTEIQLTHCITARKRIVSATAPYSNSLLISMFKSHRL